MLTAGSGISITDAGAGSTVTVAADATIARLASPALTGNPTAPTQLQADDSTKLATTAYVRAAISAILNGVSSAFDTLAPDSEELNVTRRVPICR